MRISDWSSDVCSSDLQAASRIGGSPNLLRKSAPPPPASAAASRSLTRPGAALPLALPIPATRRLLCLIVCSLSRSEEHTSELQSLMRISYAVFCLKKKKNKHTLYR